MQSAATFQPAATPTLGLRRSRTSAATHALFKDTVLKGALQARGMPTLGDVLDERQIEQIQAFLLSQAHAAYCAQQDGEGAVPVPREGPH